MVTLIAELISEPLQMGLDWRLFIYCKTKEHRFFFQVLPSLYAFQYIYCNYCKNLNTDLRATTQFGLLCPFSTVFFFKEGKLTTLI